MRTETLVGFFYVLRRGGSFRSGPFTDRIRIFPLKNTPDPNPEFSSVLALEPCFLLDTVTKELAERLFRKV
jgi:hypothetical protein